MSLVRRHKQLFQASRLIFCNGTAVRDCHLCNISAEPVRCLHLQHAGHPDRSRGLLPGVRPASLSDYRGCSYGPLKHHRGAQRQPPTLLLPQNRLGGLIMNATQLLVNIAGFAAIAWIVLWFFLYKNQAAMARSVAGGVQEVDITVQGGYSPAEIVVEVGKPVRLNFTRKEASACSEEVILPQFGKRARLPENHTVTLEVTPETPGECEFVCGMNMLHGKLIAH